MYWPRLPREVVVVVVSLSLEVLKNHIDGALKCMVSGYVLMTGLHDLSGLFQHKDL